MLKKIKKQIKRLVPEKYWSKKRKESILKEHKQVADFWHPIINSYFEGNIDKYSLLPKKNLDHSKVIWQYWGQGIDVQHLPEVVQLCFQSVDRYKGDYQVIRLTDKTISEYIDLPDFVLKKQRNSEFTRTYFSDLLRLALLTTYGGVWLDATILLTGVLPTEYAELDFFMFQRSEKESKKKYWESTYAYYWGWDSNFKVRLLNSVIFARRDSRVMAVLFDLMLHFWKTQEHVPAYFFFQILFNELITDKLITENCPIINDSIPHLLQTKINGDYDWMSFEEVLAVSNIHKMAYFDSVAMARLKTLQLGE